MGFAVLQNPVCRFQRELCEGRQQAAQRQSPAGNRAQGGNFLLLPWREQTEPLFKNSAVFQNGRIADV